MGDIKLSGAFDDPKVIALIEAACRGDAKAVHQMTTQGVNANAQGKEDARPLAWALDCGNIKGVEALLDAGADPNYRYGGEISAIWIAAGRSDSEIVKALIVHGADLNRWESTSTPLMRAMGRGANTGNWDNYYVLLNAGADINNVSDIETNLIERAITLARFDKASELLDRGFNRNLSSAYSSALQTHVNKRIPQYKQKQAFLRKLDSMGVKPDQITDRDQH